MSQAFLDWATIIGTACWVVCFWWMHKISYSQNKVLFELREQARRIETLSKAEHDLIKEVHPQVGKIKAEVTEMAAEVSDMASTIKEDLESKELAAR